MNPTPKVCCRYGAPMGRHTGPQPEGDGDKWRLQRVPIDAGGYDPGGAYWGLGGALYWACNTATGGESFFRVSPADVKEAFAALGGAPVGQPCGPEYMRSNWGCDSVRLTARYIVRREFDPAARFFR